MKKWIVPLIIRAVAVVDAKDDMPKSIAEEIAVDNIDLDCWPNDVKYEFQYADIEDEPLLMEE